MIGGLVIGLVVGCGLGAFAMAWFVSANKAPACPQCNGDRVVVYAGDNRKDDGYCELRVCGTCGTGDRIGRSDIPITTMRDVLDV